MSPTPMVLLTQRFGSDQSPPVVTSFRKCSNRIRFARCDDILDSKPKLASTEIRSLESLSTNHNISMLSLLKLAYTYSAHLLARTSTPHAIHKSHVACSSFHFAKIYTFSILNYGYSVAALVTQSCWQTFLSLSYNTFVGVFSNIFLPLRNRPHIHRLLCRRQILMQIVIVCDCLQTIKISSRALIALTQFYLIQL